MVIFYNEGSLLAKLCQELPVEIPIAFLGSKVFPEQCVLFCPSVPLRDLKVC